MAPCEPGSKDTPSPSGRLQSSAARRSQVLAMTGELINLTRITEVSLLRLLDFSGSTLGVMEGHTDSAFCLKAGQNHLVVSAGEDHSAVSE